MKINPLFTQRESAFADSGGKSLFVPMEKRNKTIIIIICRTSQYRMTVILLSVSLWNGLADPVFNGEGLAGFKSRANAFLLA